MDELGQAYLWTHSILFKKNLKMIDRPFWFGLYTFCVLVLVTIILKCKMNMERMSRCVQTKLYQICCDCACVHVCEWLTAWRYNHACVMDQCFPGLQASRCECVGEWVRERERGYTVCWGSLAVQLSINISPPSPVPFCSTS